MRLPVGHHSLSQLCHLRPGQQEPRCTGTTVRGSLPCLRDRAGSGPGAHSRDPAFNSLQPWGTEPCVSLLSCGQ